MGEEKPEQSEMVADFVGDDPKKMKEGTITPKKEKKITATPSPNKKICSKCGSGQIYVRIKEGSVVCRSCGNIDKIKSDG